MSTDWATLLRKQILQRARRYAEQNVILHYLSLSEEDPTVLFEPYDEGCKHGNFLALSYEAIQANPKWKRRLEKRHPRLKALPTDKRSKAKELDSCTSSDALLMNVFCYPGIRQYSPLARSLGRGRLADPEFGFKPRVPFASGGTDNTEVDMRMGSVLVEAKLTEGDFTSKSVSHVMIYRDFEHVFEADALPQQGGKFLHYQLIRNVLAAFDHDARFVLICDMRRPDLLRAMWQVMAAVRLPELRQRCGFLLWQEIADVVPPPVREFVRHKYGIYGVLGDEDW